MIAGTVARIIFADHRMLCRLLCTIIGLKTFSSKWPVAPPIVTDTVLPMTCAQTIVIASHWVGFTLPGMMLEPGSFSGSSSSPMPVRGPELSSRMSFAIFMNEAASTFSWPASSTCASCAASNSNLFGALTNGRPVNAAIFFATRSANSGCEFNPVPTTGSGMN